MDDDLRRVADAAIGFMAEHEGLALYEAARSVASLGPLLEIGSYCGKSAVYLGAAAREGGTTLFSIDHHRGSEEHQAGGEYHDLRLVDTTTGAIDTLPHFRRTLATAALEDVVVGVIGDSQRVASHWGTPLALVFIDGSHALGSALGDYTSWAPHVKRGGLLAIHDVFEDPAQGGRPPYEVYRRALCSGAFSELSATASLRVLERVGEGL
ncbi:MAG: class I SAM-dependent methyltransferase [Actinomycetota bacterium]